MPSPASCYVPEGTNVKKLCKWGVFPSEDVQLVKRRLCGVDGRGGCKTPVLYVGNCLFHRFPAKKEQRRELIVKIVGKIPPLTQNTCVCGAHFDGGKRQDTFPFLQDLCGLSLRKKSG